MRFKCHARRATWNDTVDIFFGWKREDGGMDAALPLTVKLMAPGMVADPALQLQHDEAQLLMDELWSAGLRPSEGSGSAGAMAAVQAHLADMRKLVFK